MIEVLCLAMSFDASSPVKILSEVTVEVFESWQVTKIDVSLFYITLIIYDLRVSHYHNPTCLHKPTTLFLLADVQVLGTKKVIVGVPATNLVPVQVQYCLLVPVRLI